MAYDLSGTPVPDYSNYTGLGGKPIAAGTRGSMEPTNMLYRNTGDTPSIAELIFTYMNQPKGAIGAQYNRPIGVGPQGERVGRAINPDDSWYQTLLHLSGIK